MDNVVNVPCIEKADALTTLQVRGARRRRIHITYGVLSAERLRQALHYEPGTGVFTWLIATGPRGKVGQTAGNVNPTGYRNIKVDGRLYKAHRLCWLYVNSVWPPGELDHVNRNKDDNRFSNLRFASHSQNLANRGATIANKSGFKGVSWSKPRRKWLAKVRVNGRIHYLGLFPTPEAAHAAYCAAAHKFVGAYARTA